MRDVPPDGVVVLMKWLWEGIVRRWRRVRDFVEDCWLTLRAWWWDERGDGKK